MFFLGVNFASLGALSVVEDFRHEEDGPTNSDHELSDDDNDNEPTFSPKRKKSKKSTSAKEISDKQMATDFPRPKPKASKTYSGRHAQSSSSVPPKTSKIIDAPQFGEHRSKSAYSESSDGESNAGDKEKRNIGKSIHCFLLMAFSFN